MDEGGDGPNNLKFTYFQSKPKKTGRRQKLGTEDIIERVLD